MRKTATGVVAAVIGLATTGMAVSPASAGTTDVRQICAESATIRHSPGGTVKLTVYRGERVTIDNYRDGVWPHTTDPTNGYILASVLC